MSYLYNMLPHGLNERLETKQLLLRPYSENDAYDFRQLVIKSKSLMAPAFSTRPVHVQTLEDARSMVEQLRADWDNRKVFDLGVWLKEANEYIGDIALKNLDHKIPKAELALYFADSPTAKAYVREAIEKIILFAFDTLALNKIYIRCTTANAYFGEVAKTCGFIREGILRSDYKGADSEELLDLSYYGMTRHDYEQHQQKKKSRAAVVV